MKRKSSVTVREKNIRFAKAQSNNSDEVITAKRKNTPAWLKKYAGALPGVSK